MSQPSGASGASPLLEVQDLVVRFPIDARNPERGFVHAVEGVSLDLHAGETLALVGESGCGKSTLARAVCGLNPVYSGSVKLLGEELVGLSRRRLREHRRKLQMVFQDPESSLNPRMTVSSLIREPLQLHSRIASNQLDARVCELLERVGLDPDLRDRYPHAFSGGQRQRICIARALAVEPQVLIGDEVTSALDVSIQSQILNLLADLRRDLGIGILFITHDLAVVRHISERVAVMYLGQIVEERATEETLARPQHPYTRGLLGSVPRVARSGSATPWDRVGILGDLPSPANPPSGCRFHTRCPIAFDRCASENPAPEPVDAGWIRCHASQAQREDATR